MDDLLERMLGLGLIDAAAADALTDAVALGDKTEAQVAAALSLQLSEHEQQDHGSLQLAEHEQQDHDADAADGAARREKSAPARQSVPAGSAPSAAAVREASGQNRRRWIDPQCS